VSVDRAGWNGSNYLGRHKGEKGEVEGREYAPALKLSACIYWSGVTIDKEVCENSSNRTPGRRNHREKDKDKVWAIR